MADGGDDNAQMQNVAVEVDHTQASAPPSAQPASSGGGPTGFSMESLKANLLCAPDGILRMIQWFLAMIAFAAAADVSYYGDCGGGDAATTCERLEFAVAVGVMIWLINTVWMVLYVMGWRSRYGFMVWAELGYDALFTLFTFAAGIALAARCNEEIPGTNGVSWCGNDDDKRNAQASAAFIILCFLTFLVSIFFDYKRYRAQ